MTLTVRLSSDLESALERHCVERGVTKSQVVQELLAEYLARPSAALRAQEPSAPYRAFEAAGLIGCIADAGPADKHGVRAALSARAAKPAAGPVAATPRRMAR